MGLPALAGVSGSNKTAADRATSVVNGSITAVGPGQAFSVWGPMNLSIWGEVATTLTTTAGSLTATVASASNLTIGDTIVGVNVPAGATIGNLVATTVTIALPIQSWSATVVSGSPTITFAADALPTNLSTLNGATIVNSPYFAAGTTITAVDTTKRTLTASANATSQPSPVGVTQVQFAPDGHAITTSGADATAVFIGSATPCAATPQLERSYDGGSRWTPCNIGGTGTIAKWTTNLPVSLAFGDPEASMLYRINAITFAGTAGVTIKYRVSTTGQAATSISLQVI